MYCKKHNLKKSTFYYYKNKQEAKTYQAPSDLSFTEVMLPRPAPTIAACSEAKEPIILDMKTGNRLIIPTDFNKQTLLKLLDCLEQHSC